MSESKLQVTRVDGVWGGKYFMVPESRIPAFMVADILARDGVARLRDEHPHLTGAQVAATMAWIEEHPELADADRQLFAEESERLASRFERHEDGSLVDRETGRVVGFWKAGESEDDQ